jgi:hypothetical protein
VRSDYLTQPTRRGNSVNNGEADLQLTRFSVMTSSRP